MASTTVERIDVPPRGESLKTKIKSAAIALRDTIISPPLPPEVSHRIEFVKSLPAEEIDRRLLLLVDGAVDREVNGKLPLELIREISRTAHTLLEILPENAHTDQTVAALARAADDTGEHELLEAALAIAREQGVPDGAHPHLTEALTRAAVEGILFRDAYATASIAHQNDTPMRIRETSKPSTNNDIPTDAQTVPMTKYEYLFHSTIRRPKTPEYTSGGIHPSFKKVA